MKTFVTLVQTRETSPGLGAELLDWLLDSCGALLGLEGCSSMAACRSAGRGCRRMLVCRAGRLLQTRLPGSQMLVVLLEGFVPTTARQFYSVLKKRVMEFPGASNIDSCVLEFDCSLDVKKESRENY